MATMSTNPHRPWRRPRPAIHHYRPVTHILGCLLVIIHMTNCIHCVSKDSTYGNVNQAIATPNLAVHMVMRNPNASRWSPKPQLSSRSTNLLLLILAGDIHPNPGPVKARRRRRRPSLPDCPICDKKVGWSKMVPALQCNSCDKWLHADCTGMTRETYRQLEADVESEWHCPTCAVTLPTERTVPPLRLKRHHGTWKIAEPALHHTKPSSKKPPQHAGGPWSKKKLPKCITTVITNANSLKGKKHHLAALIDSTNPHILIVTETKLSNRISSSEIFDDRYSVIRRDRNTKGGGVLVAVSNALDGYEVDVKIETESVYVMLHSKNQPPTLVGAVYRPPDHKINYLKDVLSELKKVIALHKPAHILLGGDFNMPGVDWSEGRVPTGTPHRKQARLLLETMQELNLTQVVDIPTRGTNTLDLLFTDVPSLISKIHSAPGLSDHDTILVDHKLKATINKKAAREVPLFNKADWPSLREKVRLLVLDYINANPPENRRSLTNNWLFLKGSLLGAIEQFIPRKKVGTRFNLLYLTPKTKRKIRKRQRVFKKACKYGRKNDWNHCKQLRKEINHELQLAFNDYINTILDPQDEKPGACKRFYTFIKSLRQESFGVGTLKAHGRAGATSLEKANMCNTQFHSAFSKEDTTSIPTPRGDPLPPMPNITISENGVLKLLKNIKPNKATGPDELPAKVLRDCAHELAPAIASFFQQSLDEGRVPDDWKQQRVHPIFKKGSRSDPGNYRPVALTSILCKTLEHIISSNINDHLERHSWLACFQHGFRKFQSCESQLLITTTDIFNTMESRGITDAVVLDFSKAFDKVPHERLMKKLAHCGIHGATRRWIRHFLIGRCQRVVIDGEESDECEVTSGVPQGSVLGPLLFIMFINNIATELDPQTKIRLLADDALLYRRIDSFEDHEKLQKDLNSLVEWADTWCMSFNTKKCYTIHIMTRHARRTAISIPY